MHYYISNHKPLCFPCAIELHGFGQPSEGPFSGPLDDPLFCSCCDKHIETPLTQAGRMRLSARIDKANSAFSALFHWKFVARAKYLADYYAMKF
jgi:hypothetical protein